jgi:hypothetical protein
MVAFLHQPDFFLVLAETALEQATAETALIYCR